MQLLLSLLLACQAQVAPLWSDTAGSAGFNDWTGGLAVDDGGFLYTLSSLTTGPGPRDAVLRKFDPSGELIWSRMHQPAGLLAGTDGAAIATSPLGGVVIVGCPNASGPGFIAAYDEGGAMQWNHLVPQGASNFVSMRGVAVDTDGQIYATAIVDNSNGSWFYTRFISLSASGQLLWNTLIEGSAGKSAILPGVKIGPIGPVILWGERDQADGQRRGSVRAYSKFGAYLWQHNDGDSAAGSVSRYADLDFTPTGDLIVVGTHGLEQSSIGVPYMVIKRVTPWGGSELWQQNWVGTPLQGARGFGVFVNSLGFPVVVGSALAGETGGGNAFLRLYDPQGVFLGTYTWTSPYGGSARYDDGLFLNDIDLVVTGTASQGTTASRRVTQGYNIFTGLAWTELRGELNAYGEQAPELHHGPGNDIYQVSMVSTGVSADWDVETVRIGAGPMTFCESQPNSLGCSPVLFASGEASVSAPSGCVLSAQALIPNQFALLFYSTAGTAQVPFGGGTLCLGTPRVRTPVQLTGGGSPSACLGSAQLDFNAWLAAGGDPSVVPGDQVWAQCWSRDPGATLGMNLTNGVTFVVQP